MGIFGAVVGAVVGGVIGGPIGAVVGGGLGAATKLSTYNGGYKRHDGNYERMGAAYMQRQRQLQWQNNPGNPTNPRGNYQRSLRR